MFNVTHSERSPTMTSTKDKPAAAAIKDLLNQSPDGLREIVRACVEPEAPKAEHDRRLLDGPHRTPVVTERVVEGVPGRQRPDSPTSKQVGRKHAPDDRRHTTLLDDAAGKTVTHV